MYAGLLYFRLERCNLHELVSGCFCDILSLDCIFSLTTFLHGLLWQGRDLHAKRPKHSTLWTALDWGLGPILCDCGVDNHRAPAYTDRIFRSPSPDKAGHTTANILRLPNNISSQYWPDPADPMNASSSAMNVYVRHNSFMSSLCKAGVHCVHPDNSGRE